MARELTKPRRRPSFVPGFAILGVLFGALVLAGPVRADVVILKNGSRFEGEILKQTESKIWIKTDLGVVTLRASSVKKIEKRPWVSSAPDKAAKKPAARTPKAPKATKARTVRKKPVKRTSGKSASPG